MSTADCVSDMFIQHFVELHADFSRRFSYDSRIGYRELAFMIGTKEDEIALKFAQGWAKPVKKIDCTSCLALNLCSKTCSKFKLFLAGTVWLMPIQSN